MGRRIMAFAPLAASFAAHAAVVGGIAGASLFGSTPSSPSPTVVAVRRVEQRTPPAPRIAVGIAGDERPEGWDAGTAESIPLDTTDPRYRPYLVGVKERIWRRWELPRGHSGRGGGTLVVEFLLARGGTLASAAVSAPSGVGAFDRAALAAVTSAAPFPPLPASLAEEQLRVHARFVYE